MYKKKLAKRFVQNNGLNCFIESTKEILVNSFYKGRSRENIQRDRKFLNSSHYSIPKYQRYSQHIGILDESMIEFLNRFPYSENNEIYDRRYLVDVAFESLVDDRILEKHNQYFTLMDN